MFAQHEPAIPSEVNDKPEPPQQGWRPGKIMLMLCSVEEGRQPQDRGRCTTGSSLPEMESTAEMQWEGALGDHKQKTVLRPGSGHAQQPPQNCTLANVRKGELYKGCTTMHESTGKPEACVQTAAPLGKGCTEQQRGDTTFQFLAPVPQVRNRSVEKQPGEKRNS